MKHYKDLLVWQKAIALVTQVYVVTRSFPREERYGLTSQIRRAAVSVPSNIAEGQARLTPGEFRQSLGIAKGSLAELDTQLIIAENLGYLTESGPLFEKRRSRAYASGLLSPSWRRLPFKALTTTD